MKILAYIFYGLLITSPIWGFFLFCMWLFDALATCHPTLTVTCPSP
jgi:hypothetical protein